MTLSLHNDVDKYFIISQYHEIIWSPRLNLYHKVLCNVFLISFKEKCDRSFEKPAQWGASLFVQCTTQQVVLGWSNQWGRDGWDM